MKNSVVKVKMQEMDGVEVARQLLAPYQLDLSFLDSLVEELLVSSEILLAA